ncbi:MAG: hypothetical protein ACLS3C_12410 [Oscillospiraceae bacterium]
MKKKGLYYIELTGGSSERICSTTISLIPPEEIEDNDVWYHATPLYEDFTQAFDISALNDMDWFRFTVPEGDQKVLLLNVSKTDTGKKKATLCISNSTGKHISTIRMMAVSMNSI